MSTVFSINKEFIKQEDAKIHVTDLGLRRGYAAFDFMRLHKGIPLFMDDHLDRFENSISLMNLELPITRAELKAHVLELIAINKQETAGLQLYLTAGEASDGVTVDKPNLLILQVPLPYYGPELYEHGGKLISHDYLRDLPEAKSTNYFRALRLSKQISAASATDVLYTHNGKVLETSRSNIFFIMPDGSVKTAKDNVLNGVSRRNLVRILPRHLNFEETNIDTNILSLASEAFISSTVRAVMPITFVDNKAIGDGKVGKGVSQIREIFDNHINSYVSANS